MRSDIYAQLADYRGVLAFPQVTEPYSGTVYKSFEVELYFKDFPIPIRKPKVTEISTVSSIDPRSNFDFSTNLIFFGAPDILQVTGSGFIITPTSNKQFVPKATDGTTLPVGNVSCGELVSAYLQGELNRSIRGGFQRVDPSYFISPYGQQYSNPIIFSWELSATVTQRKHQFTIGMYLEA